MEIRDWREQAPAQPHPANERGVDVGGVAGWCRVVCEGEVIERETEGYWSEVGWVLAVVGGGGRAFGGWFIVFVLVERRELRENGALRRRIRL